MYKIQKHRTGETLIVSSPEYNHCSHFHTFPSSLFFQAWVVVYSQCCCECAPCIMLNCAFFLSYSNACIVPGHYTCPASMNYSAEPFAPLLDASDASADRWRGHVLQTLPVFPSSGHSLPKYAASTRVTSDCLSFPKPHPVLSTCLCRSPWSL